LPPRNPTIETGPLLLEPPEDSMMVTDQGYRSILRELNEGGEGENTEREARRHGYAYVDLSRVTIEEETLSLVPAETAQKLNVLPVRKDGKKLWVCMQMPPQPRDVERLAVETNCRVIPVSAIPSALRISIDFYYSVQS
jgi:hypothetical protein